MALTEEQYRIAEENGIPKDLARRRYKYLFWDVERAITEPVQRYKERVNLSEYAVYKGEELVYIGTAKECAEHLGVLESSFRYYMSTAYERKMAKCKSSYGKRRVIIKLDEEDENVG